MEESMADNRRAYGLAKRYGIDTKGMTPEEVWKALKKKGITANNAYDSRDDFKQTVERANQVRSRNSAQDDTQKQSDNGDNAHSPPLEVFKFHRRDTKHHITHAREMGYKNMRDYEFAAKDFLEHGEGRLYYGKRRGDFAKYNPKTNEYMVCTVEGIIKTYYRINVKKFELIKIQEGFDDV